MTRDEAEKAVQEVWPKISSGALGAQNGAAAQNSYQNNLGQHSYNAPMSPTVFIKLAEALGMLKLDEPKSGKDKFRDAMALNGVYLSPLAIEMALSHAGLKIIEK